MKEEDSVALLHYLSYTEFRTAWEIWVALYEDSTLNLGVSTTSFTLENITGIMRHHRDNGLVVEQEAAFDRGQLLPTWKLAGERPPIPEGFEYLFSGTLDANGGIPCA